MGGWSLRLVYCSLCILFLTGEVQASSHSIDDSLQFEALDARIPSLIRSNPDSVHLLIREQQALLKAGRLNPAADADLRPRMLNNLGVYFRVSNDLDSSLHYYQEAYQAQDSARNPARKATVLNNIANVYFQRGAYPAALDYHFKALRIRQNITDSSGIAMSLANIGLVYENLQEPDTALRYYEDCIALAEALGDSVKMAWASTSFATLALTQGRLDAAETHLRSSLILKTALNDQRGYSFSLTNLGAVYLKRYEIEEVPIHLDSAMHILDQAAAMQTAQGNAYGLAATLNYLGEAFLAGEQPKQALIHLQKADSVTQVHQHLQERVKTLDLFSQCHEAMGNLKAALDYQRQHQSLSDTLYNAERDQEIGRKEAEFTYSQQLRDNELRFEAEMAVQEVDRKRQSLTIAVIGLSLALALVLLVWLYRLWLKARQERAEAEGVAESLAEEKQQIEEKNEELQARIADVQAKLQDQQEELPAHLEKLTKREMEVLLSLGLGLTDKEIAERLFISVATVRTHNRKIFEKLHLKNRTEAVGLIHRYRL